MKKWYMYRKFGKDMMINRVQIDAVKWWIRTKESQLFVQSKKW